MKRNEKLLAAALVAVLVGYFLWKSVVPVFVEPVATLQTERDDLLMKVSDQQQTQFESQLADRKLSESRDRGLPGSDLDAQRLYLQWLTELALASGLDVTVTPDRLSPVGDVYNSVQVTLGGTATFDELQTFLRRFRKADLLHRVFRLDVGSPAVEGDPELNIVLTAEGLNVRGTPARSRLFPQIELTEPLAASAGELTVAAEELKATPGDWLRIDNEFVTVKAVEDDRLLLTRGADGTTATEHAVGARVELLPIREPGKGDLPIVVAEIDSPFVKPRHYDPKFDGFADAKLVRGNTAAMSVKVADYDRDAGEPKLGLIDGPDGLTFDAATGKLAWTPADDVPSGEYKVTLAADVPEPQKRLEQTVTITLTDPNTSPTLDAVSATEIFLGETLQLPLKADDAESDSLAFAVEQGPPDAMIDATTNEFRWSVPESFAPGEVAVTVVATDTGDPPLSTKQTFNITVRENLKPFVHLSGTWLESGSGDGGGTFQKQAFLYDRSENQWTRLREGRPFEAAGLKALVKEIGSDFVVYVRNGEIWKIRVGSHLGEAEKIGEEPVAAMRPTEERSPVEAVRPPDETASVRPSPATAAAEAMPPM
ncbi:MAG: putative Ig domain-containing protein [Planctomycetaceae bacterium]